MKKYLLIQIIEFIFTKSNLKQMKKYESKENLVIAIYAIVIYFYNAYQIAQY